jgi:thiol-disulfide isomerase/thioredoxin
VTLSLVVSVVARLVLAAVFLWAGLLKLIALPPARDALSAFGLRGRPAHIIGWVLPFIEIAVALALVWPATAFAGAVVSLLLLSVFTFLIYSTLQRGDAPPCNCFGTVSAKPMDQRTLWRNGVLLLLAAAAVTAGLPDPGPSLVAWAGTGAWGGHLGGALVIVSLGLVIVLIGILQMFRQSLDTQRDLQASVAALERMVDQRAAVPAHRAGAAMEEGLPLGAPAPWFESLHSLLSDGRPLLLFSGNSACGSCTALAPRIRQWAADYRDHLRIVALYDSSSLVARTFGDNVTVIGGAAADIAASYRLQWTPGAVLVDRNARIASPVAFGEEAIASLVTTAASADSNPTMPLARLFDHGDSGLRIGTPAPPIDVVGSAERVLLFWRDSCPHCAGIASDVQRWGRDATRHTSSAELVVVNWSGEPVGIDGVPVVSDPAGKVAQSFGVQGTPSALRIDAEGRIASAVAIGGVNVLALMGLKAQESRPH